MDLHNTVEDTVIARVDDIFKALKEEGNKGKFCTCDQCRMDVVCYALNRLRPHYIVSHRGASRVQAESFEKQQHTADIAALIHDGLKRVNHNQRPNFSHSSKEGEAVGHDSNDPVFNVPTIMGRLFNGINFEPLFDVDVELLYKGELVAMKDGNWHNPCRLVSHTEGTFSFWPAPTMAAKVNSHEIFEYTLRVTSPEFETLNHFFKIPVASEIQAASSFNLDRTFKLPDLYMFPPGEAEKNGYLD
ncbi:MAG: late competence development ComFB family protein [Treponema sp.]|jgi:competence protein ComFB|nr:late competence development ComFB family protein [Treponema sp.]